MKTKDAVSIAANTWSSDELRQGSIVTRRKPVRDRWGGVRYEDVRPVHVKTCAEAMETASFVLGFFGYWIGALGSLLIFFGMILSNGREDVTGVVVFGITSFVGTILLRRIFQGIRDVLHVQASILTQLKVDSRSAVEDQGSLQ